VIYGLDRRDDIDTGGQFSFDQLGGDVMRGFLVGAGSEYDLGFLFHAGKIPEAVAQGKAWVPGVEWKALNKRVVRMFSFRSLLALFFIVPIIEIYLLIQVGGLIGAIPTVFLVVFTAVLGALLLRQQGFATLKRVQESLGRGELPALELLEGAVLLFGGALLLTPGFFTDALGFVCLLPPLRQGLIRWAISRGVLNVSGASSSSGQQHHGPRTIEGEYWRDKDGRR